MFNKFKKIFLIFLVTLLICFIYNLSVFAQVFELSSLKNQYNTEINKPEIFKPSRLIIGSKTVFIVKAEPGSSVTFILSDERDGSEPFYGQHLRLGDFVYSINGTVGEKGITELKVELPDEKNLTGNIFYFEAIVWKNKDFSDLTKAKIIGTNGKETGSNAIIAARKPEKKSMPGFGQAMPGIGDISKSFEALAEQESAVERDYNISEDGYYYNKPLMLRNLRAPELQKEREK